jgi:endonuclease YncB( thermonuclease family)
MFKRALLVISLATLSTSPDVFAHSGAVDKSGCHTDAKTSTRHCHKERAATATKKKVAACDMPAPKAGDEGFLFGPVVAIVDGDSLRAKIQGAEMDFRLSDLDAPEMNQPYGGEAKDALNAFAAGKDIVVLPLDTDSYGRTVAHLWVNGVYVNRELVKGGAAWFYPEFAKGDCLYWVEQKARTSRRGLWGLPPKTHIEPWEWRKRKKS